MYITKICSGDCVGVCLAYIHGTEKNPQPQRQTSVPGPQLVKIITKIALSPEIGYTMIPGETPGVTLMKKHSSFSEGCYPNLGAPVNLRLSLPFSESDRQRPA